jgi:hypothetical protein
VQALCDEGSVAAGEGEDVAAPLEPSLITVAK